MRELPFQQPVQPLLQSATSNGEPMRRDGSVISAVPKSQCIAEECLDLPWKSNGATRGAFQQPLGTPQQMAFSDQTNNKSVCLIKPVVKQ